MVHEEEGKPLHGRPLSQLCQRHGPHRQRRTQVDESDPLTSLAQDKLRRPPSNVPESTIYLLIFLFFTFPWKEPPLFIF